MVLCEGRGDSKWRRREKKRQSYINSKLRYNVCVQVGEGEREDREEERERILKAEEENLG